MKYKEMYCPKCGKMEMCEVETNKRLIVWNILYVFLFFCCLPLALLLIPLQAILLFSKRENFYCVKCKTECFTNNPKGKTVLDKFNEKLKKWEEANKEKANSERIKKQWKINRWIFSFFTIFFFLVALITNEYFSAICLLLASIFLLQEKLKGEKRGYIILALVLIAYFSNNYNQETSKPKDDNVATESVSNLPQSIEGLYLVHADEYNRGVVKWITACTTPKNLDLYEASLAGDLDYNSTPELTRTKKCILLDNIHDTMYSIKVKKVNENGKIVEIIKEDANGDEAIYYTNLDPATHNFYKHPYGKEREEKDEQVIKEWEENAKDKVFVSEVAQFACLTPKDFSKAFFGHYDITNGKPKNCFKIKSKTEQKSINIDRKTLWRQYEILSGEHKGKKLWKYL